jgi:hypothetical protein
MAGVGQGRNNMINSASSSGVVGLDQLGGFAVDPPTGSSA